MKLLNKNQQKREDENFSLQSRRLFINLLFAFIFIGASFSIAEAQGAGSLDTTFGAGGKVTTAFSTDFSFGFASAIQSDGKIVVAGSTQKTGTGTDRDFFIARYLPNGSLDNSFGKRGTATISFYSNLIERAADIVIQPDGKIVVLGETSVAGGTVDFVTIRLNNNGTPDISFGIEGTVITDFSGTDDRAAAVALDSSNRIVVSGYKIVLPFNSEQTVLARLQPNGSLDTTFGTGGKLIPVINIGSNFATDILIQPTDNKIVAVGYASNESFIARFLPDGSFDTSFGASGKRIAGYAGTSGFATGVARNPLSGGFVTVNPLTITATGQRIFGFFSFTSEGNFDISFGPEGDGAATLSFGTNTDFPTGIAIQPDGKIVASGWTRQPSGNTDFALARLSNSGLIDNSFGTSGKTIVPMNSGFANALNLQTDGKIIQIGYSGAPPPMNRGSITIVRYNTNGILDSSFGFDGNGIVQTAVGSSDYADKTVVQPDGKIIVGGQTDQSRTSFYSDFVLTRYNADGTLDTTFGTGGKVQTDFRDGYDGISSLVIQPDGRIVAAGRSALNNAKYDYALARYHTNGSLDTSFGVDGKVIADFLSDYEFIRDIAIQEDGKIVAVGYDELFFPSSASDFITLRFKPDGGIDSGFGTGGIVRTDFGILRGDESNAVAVQTDGKIVVAGTTARSDGLANIAAVRYESNGALDTTFDVDGKVSVAFPSVSAFAKDVAVDADGNLIVVGASGLGTDVNFALVRLKNDGLLDTAFDGDGRATVNFDTSLSGAEKTANNSLVTSNDHAYAVTIQPSDGKIVVAGYTGIGETYDFALARLNSDGSPDTSFDTDGKTTTNFGGNDFGNSVAIQPDGKIVVAGTTESFSDTDFAIARYNAFSPTAANAFVSGRITTADGRGIRNARLVLTDSLGASRYVSTGSFGYYCFDDLPTGATYVLTVYSKRFVFTQPTVVINLTEDLAEMNFMSEP